MLTTFLPKVAVVLPADDFLVAEKITRDGVFAAVGRSAAGLSISRFCTLPRAHGVFTVRGRYNISNNRAVGYRRRTALALLRRPCGQRAHTVTLLGSKTRQRQR
jgi:hypothetical protein